MTILQALKLLTTHKNFQKHINKLQNKVIYIDIGLSIKQWRLARNLSIRDAANFLRVSKSAFGDVECGERNPLTILKKIKKMTYE